jgi:hypothetical protein
LPVRLRVQPWEAQRSGSRAIAAGPSTRRIAALPDHGHRPGLRPLVFV